MDWLGLYSGIRDWAETQLTTFPMLAAAGVALGALAIVFMSWKIVRGVLKLGLRFSDASAARTLRKDNAPGYRILMADTVGAAPLGKWLQLAVDKHLPAFNFGAPFRTARISSLAGGLEPRAMKRARALMISADADMIVWSERTAKDATGFEIYGLSRGGGLTALEAKPFHFELPGRLRGTNERTAAAAAYLLAKALQPALAYPQAFRPEKIKELADELAGILAAKTGVSEQVHNEIESDYCAACVHVAESSGDLAAIDEVIAMRRGHLENLAQGGSAERIIQAHMDLGRALLARAEKQFDQRTVQLAIQHLSNVVENLRADPTIQRAQSASDAMFKAQTLIETRKRFSVNFGS